jgi:hypothetical protein
VASSLKAVSVARRKRERVLAVPFTVARSGRESSLKSADTTPYGLVPVV